MKAADNALLPLFAAWLKRQEAVGRLPWCSQPEAGHLVLAGNCIGVRAARMPGSDDPESDVLDFSAAAAAASVDHHCAVLLPSALLAFVASAAGIPAGWVGSVRNVSQALAPLLSCGAVRAWRSDERPLSGMPLVPVLLFSQLQPQAYVVRLHGPGSIAAWAHAGVGAAAGRSMLAEGLD
ncbi:hypothetical protein MW290_21005 [Aquincola tertiaricarbonis]|uniref:Uncharacterized protein n=1 Tax=Aquincola tertiaricarbonis TaxID=391953 RepID=A0ABY4SFR2_AQUTE|nr:hypothetical protein [Aquincola tertiaricarbonis]URI11425.1 hypothetical protein MW290_21005 [Aquincola tertiaricarbonis]